jgi:hypothetical protein
MHHSDFDAHQTLTPVNPTEVYSPHTVVSHHIPRNVIRFYTDNWVLVGPGHEKNCHRPQHGFLLREWMGAFDDPFDYMTLTDGRTFRRSINYASHSPYGWNEIKEPANVAA